MDKRQNGLNQPLDLNSWEYRFDYVHKHDELTKEEKEEVITGLSKLKNTFDDDWLHQAIKQGHPLISYLWNFAARSFLWLANFAARIDDVRRMDKSEELIKRLKDAKEYGGAEAELNVIAKLRRVGINSIELHPENVARDKRKKPDLRVAAEGKDVYFEIKLLGEHEDSIRSSETFHELAVPFFYEVIHFCQIHKSLSKPHIKELKDKIHAGALEVARTKGYAYIGEPGVIDYLLVHESRRKDCLTLAEQFSMKCEVTGASAERDDISRIKFRLNKKNLQLPFDKPGVLVVYGYLYPFNSIETLFSELVYRVDESVYDQHNLIGLVVVNRMHDFQERNDFVVRSNYTFIRKSNKLGQETIAIIPNKYSVFLKDEKIKVAFDKITEAFKI